MFDSREMDCGYFTLILPPIITEYQYLDPWYQINGSTLDDIRFFYTTLLLTRGLILNMRSNLFFSH